MEREEDISRLFLGFCLKTTASYIANTEQTEYKTLFDTAVLKLCSHVIQHAVNCQVT
jgi:hypothetical protein